MKLSLLAIDQPRIVYVATALIHVTAIFAAIHIPVQRTPAISKAVILVAVPHPGAQPTEVEEQITRKIETKLQRLNKVEFVSSTSMRGTSITQVMFLDGVDPDTARGEVKDLVDEVRRELPGGRDVVPIVTDIDFENTPLMLVNMIPPADFDPRALKQLAEEVQEELEAVTGVASTQLFGGRERELHVNVNVDLASQYGITLNDVRRTLASYHAELPGGELDNESFNYRVRSDTKFQGVQDIEHAVVKHVDGRTIRVADVADVSDTYRRMLNVAHLDGQDCATIIVYKEADINTLQTARAISARVDELQRQYGHLKFSVTRDTSEEISIMFRVLGSSFVFGAMLVLLILGWTMGLRISLLVLTAIPVCTAVTLVVLYFGSIAISNMVVFAGILVVGMVVDGAIIVGENIHRHIEMGEEPHLAAKRGIEEVGVPVIMADLTTVAAYLPMLLVPGIMGDFLSVMPIVVAVALLGSMLVDHFLLPVLAARWFTRQVATIQGDDDDDSLRRYWIVRLYESSLRWSVDHGWAIMACVVLSQVWAVFMLNRVGFTFFPPSDRGQFEIKYEMPLGTSLHESIAAAKVITEPLEELRKRTGEVVHFVSAIGSSEGLASRLETDPAIGPEFGIIMVQLLSPLDRERHEDLIIAEVRQGIEARLPRFPGMKYSVVEVEEGPPGGYDVAVRFTGDDLEALGTTATGVVEQIGKLSGTDDASTDYRAENPELVFEPNPYVLPFFNIDKVQFAAAVQTAVTGDNSILLSIGDEDVTLRLQASSAYREGRQGLERIMLSGGNGKVAPLDELADVRRVMGVHAVNRYERKRAVLAHCNVDSETRPDKIFAVLRGDILPAIGFRPIAGNPNAFLGQPGTSVEGIRATFTGENEERDENFGYLQTSMLIAVILIFAILVLQFNSFRQASIVMLTVPLSFVGVVGGMWLCHFPFSLATFIGLVSLAGIVVNDAIVVVDFVNQSRRHGHTVRDAVLQAGVRRLRPVLLTTATTVGGLLPLFLNLSGGAEFWQPLTGAIIFGLSLATLLTLYVIPVAYILAYEGRSGRAFHAVRGWLFGAEDSTASQ